MTSASSDTIAVPHDVLHRNLLAILVGLGVPDDRAGLVATTLVDADLKGVHSHGSHLIALYVGRIRSGHILPDAPIAVVDDAGSTVQLDSGLGMGQVAGVQAIDLAVERARAYGLAAVTVRELTHLGALGYYTERAARAGLMAMVVQNGPAFVPPFGGITPMFSTNPFSYALPTCQEPPVVFDIATTAAAGNKILLAVKRGDETIPEGWAIDRLGVATTDPAEAAGGYLQWFGGHKGYGIAFFVEVMAGVLANSSFGLREHTASPVHGKDRVAKGSLFLALDVTRFLPGDEFGRRVDELIRDVRASEPAVGQDRVYSPGEIEHRNRATRLESGIPLAAALVTELEQFARDLGIASTLRGRPELPRS